MRSIGMDNWRPKAQRRGDNHYVNRNQASGSYLFESARNAHKYVYMPRQAVEIGSERPPRRDHAIADRCSCVYGNDKSTGSGPSLHSPPAPSSSSVATSVDGCRERNRGTAEAHSDCAGNDSPRRARWKYGHKALLLLLLACGMLAYLLVVNAAVV